MFFSVKLWTVYFFSNTAVFSETLRKFQLETSRKKIVQSNNELSYSCEMEKKVRKIGGEIGESQNKKTLKIIR